MSRPPTPLPDALRHGPFLTSHARAAGLSRWHLEAANVRRLYRDVYVDASLPDTPTLHGAAALLALPRGSVLSHSTAAVLRGLPVPDSTDVHAIVPRTASRPRVAGIRVHRLADVPEQALVGKLRVTSAARTWVDLTDDLDRIDLIILGDATLNRGFATQEDLQAEVDHAAGRGVAPIARRTLPHLESRAESPMETRLRMLLVDAGLPRPIANQPIYDEIGGWLGCPDLQYAFVRLLLEYEGDHHRTDKNQFRKDIRRDESYRDNDWEVLRFVADDIFVRPKITVERVRRHLERLRLAS